MFIKSLLNFTNVSLNFRFYSRTEKQDEYKWIHFSVEWCSYLNSTSQNHTYTYSKLYFAIFKKFQIVEKRLLMLIKCATVLSFYLFIAYLHGCNTSTKTMGSRSQFMVPLSRLLPVVPSYTRLYILDFRLLKLLSVRSVRKGHSTLYLWRKVNVLAPYFTCIIWN